MLQKGEEERVKKEDSMYRHQTSRGSTQPSHLPLSHSSSAYSPSPSFAIDDSSTPSSSAADLM